VSFGRDFEQQLSFCVEARATFCNLEPVIIHLIHVSTLCLKQVLCIKSGVPNLFCQSKPFNVRYLLEAPPEILFIYLNNLTTHLHAHTYLMLVT